MHCIVRDVNCAIANEQVLLYSMKIKLKLSFGPFRPGTLKVTVVFDLHFGFGVTFMMGPDIIKTLKLYNIVNHN